jgi:hypothetical protein
MENSARLYVSFPVRVLGAAVARNTTAHDEAIMRLVVWAPAHDTDGIVYSCLRTFTIWIFGPCVIRPRRDSIIKYAYRSSKTTEAQKGDVKVKQRGMLLFFGCDPFTSFWCIGTGRLPFSISPRKCARRCSFSSTRPSALRVLHQAGEHAGQHWQPIRLGWCSRKDSAAIFTSFF